MFTSRSGAARRAAHTVVAERRSAAPPWRRAGARTHGATGRVSHRPWSAGPPGHRPQARLRSEKSGPHSDGYADARSHLVGRGAPPSIRRRPRPPSPASRRPRRLSTPPPLRPQPGDRASAAAPATAPSSHGHDAAGRPAEGTARAAGRGTGAGRPADHRTVGRAAGRPGGRDADVGGAGRRPGRAHEPGARDGTGGGAGAGGGIGAHPGERSGARSGARSGPGAGTGIRVGADGGAEVRARSAAARVVHVAAASGAGRRRAVPRADPPLRSGPPRCGPDRRAGRRGARRRGGHRRLRRDARGPRRGVGAAPRRAADHLRTGGRRGHGVHAGGRGHGAGHGRARAPRLPHHLPALGRPPRAGQLRGSAPPGRAAARPAAAAARPVAARRATGRSRPGCPVARFGIRRTVPRAGPAAGRRAVRATG